MTDCLDRKNISKDHKLTASDRIRHMQLVEESSRSSRDKMRHFFPDPRLVFNPSKGKERRNSGGATPGRTRSNDLAGRSTALLIAKFGNRVNRK